MQSDTEGKPPTLRNPAEWCIASAILSLFYYHSALRLYTRSVRRHAASTSILAFEAKPSLSSLLSYSMMLSV